VLHILDAEDAEEMHTIQGSIIVQHADLADLGE
jgi:hypothetical protein